jgi:hypothetical protein
MSIKFIVLSTVLAVSARAGATTAQDLALTCGGHYKVLTSVPYFKDNTGTRAPNFAGTNETIEVLDVAGSGCKILADYYGLSVKVGQVLDYGVGTGESYEAAVEQAKLRQGQTFPFSTEQHYTYLAKDGTLPLFPLVHEEHATLLNLWGSPNVKTLYGTPDLADLTDAELAGIYQEIMGQKGYGKTYHYNDHGDAWLSLALKLKPHELDAQKEYATNLVNLFQNVTIGAGSFVTLSAGKSVGETLNSLLNELGGTKWAPKLLVWKQNPLLFDDQIVGWARFETVVTKAPLLNEAELEEFLTFALETAQTLKLVQWVPGAWQKIGEFKTAAKSILVASHANGPQPPLYVLTPKAQELAQTLAEFR